MSAPESAAFWLRTTGVYRRRRTTLALSLLLAASLLIPRGAAADTRSTGAGRELFEAHCAMCHGADASGMMGVHPSLRGARDRLTREGVEVAVRRGRDTRPPMPAFGDRLTDEEIELVIDYVASLPSGPRNFGPRSDGGMMGDGPADGPPTAVWGVVALLIASLAGVVGGLVGYLVGRGRR